MKKGWQGATRNAMMHLCHQNVKGNLMEGEGMAKIISILLFGERAYYGRLWGEIQLTSQGGNKPGK